MRLHTGKLGPKLAYESDDLYSLAETHFVSENCVHLKLVHHLKRCDKNEELEGRTFTYDEPVQSDLLIVVESEPEK